MANWKKIATIAAIGGITVIVVAVGIRYLASKTTSTIVLEPGFRRKFVSIIPTSTERIWVDCYRYNSETEEPEAIPSSDNPYAYGDKEPELTLELKEDFTRPIIITVRAVDSIPDEQDADPAIEISKPDGTMSACYDYSETLDGEHGNEEVLNTSNRNVVRRFEPKQGTYYVNLWSYYQPAKQYEVIISEGD